MYGLFEKQTNGNDMRILIQIYFIKYHFPASKPSKISTSTDKNQLQENKELDEESENELTFALKKQQGHKKSIEDDDEDEDNEGQAQQLKKRRLRKHLKIK
jgi:hypothetical protein